MARLAVSTASSIGKGSSPPEALRARGVEVEYMVKDDEGHGFHNQENRFDFYRAMERFLKEQMG